MNKNGIYRKGLSLLVFVVLFIGLANKNLPASNNFSKNIEGGEGVAQGKSKVEVLVDAKINLKNALDKGSKESILDAKYSLLQAIYELERHKEVLKLGFELIEDSDFQKRRDVIKVTSLIKKTYYKEKKYEELLDFFPVYQKLNKRHGRDVLKSDYLNDNYLSNIHYQLKNYTKAIVYFKNRAQFHIEIGDKLGESSVYNDVGLCFQKLKKWDSAQFYYELAIKTIVLDTTNSYNLFMLDVYVSNKADYDYLNGDFDKALIAYKKELNSSKLLENSSILISAYMNSGRVFYSKKEYNKSLLYVDSAIFIAYSSKEFNYLSEAFNYKARCLAALGFQEEADVYFTKEKDRLDSISIASSKENYFTSSTKYEVERKEYDLAISKEKVKREKEFSLLVLLGTIILGVFTAVLYFFYRRTKKAKGVISKQKQEAEKESNEKGILLKEVHHRVKNNLQVITGLLELQGNKINEPKVFEMVSETQKYIHSMSLVHEMLYQDTQLANINIQSYLKKLLSFTVSSQLKKDVKANIFAEEINLPLDKAMPLGLVVTELISNSFKHGFVQNVEGEINISLMEKNGIYVLNYMDNGIGLANDFSILSTRTLGFRLIKMFAEELQGSLRLGEGDGFSLYLEFNKEI